MRKTRDYLSPAAVNPAVRIGVLVSEAHSLATFSRRGFFVRCTRQVLWAGRVGRGNPRRPSDRYSNLHGLPTLIGIGVSGKRNRFLRTATMCTDTPVIDRAIAAKINPLISSLWTEDTLDSLSRVVNDMGYFLSIAADSPEGTEPHFGHLYLLFGAISGALAYEVENMHSHSVTHIRKERKNA